MIIHLVSSILGRHCEIGADLCWNNPCKNGATCSTLSGTYQCQCMPPYGGTHCDLVMNVCTPNPCLNDGHCVRISDRDLSAYRCDCLLGFTGSRCEKGLIFITNSFLSLINGTFFCLVDGCSSSPCKNGGLCQLSINNCSLNACPVECQCPIGISGPFCERIESSCLIQPCLNGGTCQIDKQAHRHLCLCSSNTTGAR